MEDKGIPSQGFKQISNMKEHSVNLVWNALERSTDGNREIGGWGGDNGWMAVCQRD